MPSLQSSLSRWKDAQKKGKQRREFGKAFAAAFLRAIKREEGSRCIGHFAHDSLSHAFQPGVGLWQVL